MRYRLLLTAVFTTILLLNSLVVCRASFEEDFTIDYDISYEVQKDGETTVNQKTIITNLKPDFVPTNYSLSIKLLDIYEVSATANQKTVEAQSNKIEDGYEISSVIANHVIGKGRQNVLELKYKTKGIATRTGNIWNITIPKIQTPNTTSLYNVKVLLPQDFGDKLYFSPAPVVTKKENDKTAYYLTKESFKNSGISAAFGKYQSINFNLKYQLENKSFFTNKMVITLPPDIQKFQQVSYQDINPKPLRIYQDDDGNTLAEYSVGFKKKLDIQVKGTAKIIPMQINPELGGQLSAVSKDLIRKYTKTRKFWQVGAPQVKQTAEKLFDPKSNLAKNAYNAYLFVTQNLTYDYESIKKTYVQRAGAYAALTTKGSWTCMEFTDLFISIVRAMGIPARELNGYAISGNENSNPISINLKGGDLLHSWAEFYDPVFGWVQVDPTWGSTSGIDYFSKLDTNHLVLAIHGLDSEKPLPAGAYRYDDTAKLVDIDFNQNPEQYNSASTVTIKKAINVNVFQMIKGNIKYQITNKGNTYIYVAGKPVPPNGNTMVYVAKNAKNYTYQDTFGTVFNLTLQ